MDNNNDLLALNDPKLYVQSTRFCFPNAKYTYFVIWTILFVYSGLSFSRSWITLFGILWLGTGFESVSHQMMEHLLSGCPLQPLLPLSISVDITIYKTMWRVLNQNLTVGLFHIWNSANLDQCFNWSINVLAKLVLGKMNINSWFIRTNKVPRTWIWFYSLFIGVKPEVEPRGHQMDRVSPPL